MTDTEIFVAVVVCCIVAVPLAETFMDVVGWLRRGPKEPR